MSTRREERRSTNLLELPLTGSDVGVLVADGQFLHGFVGKVEREALRLSGLERGTGLLDECFLLLLVHSHEHPAVLQGSELAVFTGRRNDQQSIGTALRQAFTGDQALFLRTNPLFTRIFQVMLSFRIDQFDLREKEMSNRRVSLRPYVIEMPFHLFARIGRDVEQQTNVLRMAEILQFRGEGIVSTGFETLRKVGELDGKGFGLFLGEKREAEKARARAIQTAHRNVRSVKDDLPRLRHRRRRRNHRGTGDTRGRRFLLLSFELFGIFFIFFVSNGNLHGTFFHFRLIRGGNGDGDRLDTPFFFFFQLNVFLKSTSEGEKSIAEETRGGGGSSLLETRLGALNGENAEVTSFSSQSDAVAMFVFTAGGDATVDQSFDVKG